MTTQEIIQQLKDQRERLDKAIQALEGSASTSIKRKGRKSPSEAERKRSSIRMKKYWANRKKQNKVTPINKKRTVA